MNYPRQQNLQDNPPPPTGGRHLQALGADNAPFAMSELRDLAYMRQTAFLEAQGKSCLTQQELNAINNKNARENHPQNCAKLNAAGGGTPYFNAGVMQAKKTGKFAYFSSRNNNFSNRDQTGVLCVGTDKSKCGNTPDPDGVNGD